jgi:selT/selW/selH-like putative selenoprotein
LTDLNIDAQLIKGDNGVFNVVANGSVIFSKDESGRFPEDQEIVDALRSLV